MKTFHYIIVLVLFAAGSLFGLQIPNFVDQYQKRIDAHYLEANESFKGFQDIANRFHDGNIESLIKKHEASSDTTFNAEAEPLRKIFARKIRFEREHNALQTSLFGKAKHIAFAGDQEIIEETYNDYSPGLPLDINSIIWGLSIAFILTILYELMLALLRRLFRIGRHVNKLPPPDQPLEYE